MSTFYQKTIKGVKIVMIELEENSRKLQDLKDRLLKIGDSL